MLKKKGLTKPKRMSEFIIRTAQPDDVYEILRIQACCYQPDFLENEAAFASKIQASPHTCWLLASGSRIAAYLVSIPVDRHTFPALNATKLQLSETPELLYWHDMAVHPDYRGDGIAARLAAYALQQAQQLGFRQVGLIAVQDSSTYWQRHGFQVANSDTFGLTAKVASFGEGAVFMQQTL